MTVRILESGQRFHRLVVVCRDPLKYKRPGKKGGRSAKWWCRCDCGNLRSVFSYSLTSGRSKSCGCFNKEQTAKLLRKPNNLGPKRGVFNQYRGNAKSRGIAMNLSFEDFCAIIELPCNYCGRTKTSTFCRIDSYNEFKYTGVDRIDPTKPYSKENAQPCCSTCNWCKMERTHEEFISWLDLTARFNGYKKDG